MYRAPRYLAECPRRLGLHACAGDPFRIFSSSLLPLVGAVALQLPWIALAPQGLHEFLLVQWLAPLASEAPEFIVALVFVWRGQAAAGMRALISSKVNQWTLLIATLPLVFSLGAGTLSGMPLVVRQQHELWLTAAQSLFAVVLISDFAMRRRDALALLAPFVVQLALPPTIGGVDVRMAFTIGYLAIGVALLLDPQRRMAIRSWPRDVQDVLLRQPMQAETADVGAAGVSKSM